MLVGEHWTSRWWGGCLSDGTEIVVNPRNPATAIFDLTDEDAESPAGMYQPVPDSLRSWLSDRSSVPAQRLRGSFGAAPSRGALLAALAALVMPAAVLVISSISDVLMLFLAVFAGIGLAHLVLIKDVKRSGRGHALDIDPGDDPHLAPVRYVPESVSASSRWRSMADKADEITAEDDRAEPVLERLWQGADVDTYFEDGSLHPAGKEALEHLEHEVRQIVQQRPQAAQ